MSAYEEFANFMRLNLANLAASYVQLLEEKDEGYKKFPAQRRMAAARKLLKAVIEACEAGTAAPVQGFFNGTPDKDEQKGQRRAKGPLRVGNGLADGGRPGGEALAEPLLEIECLGQMLNPVITNLEAGKFLWQMLAEVRAMVWNGPARILTGPLPAEGGAPASVQAGQIEEGEADGSLGLNEIGETGRTLMERADELKVEQPYQQILDAMSDLVLVKGAQSRIIWANKAFRDYYGMSNEQLQNLIDAPFNEPDYTQQYIKDDAYVFRTGETLNIPEEPVTRYDGVVRLFHTVKSALRDAEGKVVMTVGVSRDITEQKEVEEALREISERYEIAVQGSHDGLWDWNVITNEVYFSPRWKEMIGYEDDEIANDFAEFESRLHPEDHDRVMTMVADYLEGRLPIYDPEFRWRHKDGSYRWILARGVALRDAGGRPTRMAGSHTDITQWKAVEAALAKRAVDLETVAEVSVAASSTLEVERLLQTVVDLTKSSFKLYHAHIYLLNETGETLELAAGAGEMGRQMVAEGWRIPVEQEQSLVARAARSREGVIANDVRADLDWLPNRLLPETRAEMAIPVIAGDSLLGVLDVQADMVNHFTAEDVQIQTILAAQVANALRNARLFSQMERALAEVGQSQQLLEAVINATPDWIFIKDREHRYRLVNQGYAFSLHLGPDDFIGKNDLELGFPEEMVKGDPAKGIRGFWTDDRRVMESGEALIIESEPAMVDDKAIVLSTIKAPLRDRNGAVWGVLGFARNVTEREQLLAETQLLYEVSAQLNAVTSLDELVKVMAWPEIAPGAEGVTLSTFELNSRGEPEWSKLAASWRREEGQRIATRGPSAQEGADGSGLADGPGERVIEEIPIGTRFYLPDIPLAKVWMDEPNQPILIGDVVEDERVDPVVRGLLERSKIQAAAFMPLTFSGQWVGLISLVWAGRYEFSQREERLYRALAVQVAATVHNRLLLEETQKRTAQLEKLAQVESGLSQAVNEEEMLAAVAMILPAGEPARVALNYVETNEAGEPVSSRTVASWRDGALWRDDPALDLVVEVEKGSTSRLWLNEPNAVLFIENVLTDGRVDEMSREMADQLKFKGMAVIPLRSGGRWQGTLTFTWPEAHPFPADEQFVFRQLLEPAGAVVASRRAYVAQQANLVLTQGLYRAGQRISEANELQEMVAAMAEAVPVAAINRAVLMLSEYDSAGEMEAMTVVANWHSGHGSLPTPVGRRYDRETIRILNLFLSPKPLFFDDMEQDERVDSGAGEIAQRQNIRSLGVLPLWAGGRQLGVLLLETEEVHSFTKDEIEPCIALVGQMAVALDNQRLLRQAQERARRLSVLNEVGHALISGAEIGLALHRVTETLVEHFGAVFARLWILDEASQTLVLRASSGLYTHLDGGHARVPVGQFKIGLIAQERRPYLTNEVLNDSRLGDPEWARREKMVAFAGYPLLVGERLIGVLAMFSREPISKEVIATLGELAERTAIALDNRQLLEETRRRAYREQMIRQITEKMRAASSLEELVRTTARELGEQFGTEYTLVELGVEGE